MYFVFLTLCLLQIFSSISGLWVEEGKGRRSWKDQHPQHRYIPQVHAEHYHHSCKFFKQKSMEKLQMI
uniref:Secreted protein n=1 Tax=Strongyloides papillosus TaxID=174720 RepID=A0A0N5BDZ8_STREA